MKSSEGLPSNDGGQTGDKWRRVNYTRSLMAVLGAMVAFLGYSDYKKDGLVEAQRKRIDGLINLKGALEEKSEAQFGVVKALRGLNDELGALNSEQRGLNDELGVENDILRTENSLLLRRVDNILDESNGIVSDALKATKLAEELVKRGSGDIAKFCKDMVKASVSRCLSDLRDCGDALQECRGSK